MKEGTNFNEEPLTFEEFIAHPSPLVFVCNNFFYNFYNYDSRIPSEFELAHPEVLPSVGRNYERLKTINKELADELSKAFYEYSNFGGGKKPETNDKIEGCRIPKSIIKKGYQAYLILRENFKDDATMLSELQELCLPGHPRLPDDRIFFM